MNTREVQFLRRLIADRPEHRTHDGVAASMAATEGVGAVKGSRVFYKDSDFLKAENILKTRVYDVEEMAGAFTRSEAPRGGSEKAGAMNVTSGFVACRGIGLDSVLKVTGEGFCALRVPQAMRMDHEAILVCENLEALIRLESYPWLKTFYKDRKVLAVFRGSKTWFTTDAAAELINTSLVPTLAFFDFDPKGLSMAASLPRRESLCLPDLDILERKAKEMARQNLFTNSVQHCRAHLDAVVDPEIVAAWQMMKRITVGLNQEQF
jgi:hypothetical protein